MAACSSERSPAPPATQAPPPANVVTFIARDYSFEGPAQVPAGTTVVRLDNQGKELHHLVVVRLEDGRTFDSLLVALRVPGPPPKWVHPVGGPNAINPGGGSNATLNLAEGHYAILCFIPSADAVPHLAKGMISPLEVTAAVGPAAREVAADVTIKLSDYAFYLSSPLTPGTHVIQVDNDGPQPHELALIRLKPGKTVKDIEAWEKGGEKGVPPIDAVGGISPMASGETGQFTVELTPGDYVLMCFISDAKDGKAHLAHGMIKPVKVG
jgi:uncharacterized cupredoxin-like copper-binding protein